MASKIKLPQVKRPEKTSLTTDQVRALVRATGEREEGIILLALDTGMRPGELFGLHWADVDFGTRTVFVRRSLEEIRGKHRLKETKTAGSRRRIIISPSTADALQRHRERMEAAGRDATEGIVFADTQGKFIRQSNFLRYVFRPLTKRAGIPPIRLYDVRHTAATLLLQASVSIKVVSASLGHDDIQTTLKHYAHALPDFQEMAATAFEAMITGGRRETAADVGG